jgi:hypothetical protein
MYYVLAVKENHNWSPAFSDCSYDIVSQERDYIHQCGVKTRNMKIIKVAKDSQRLCDEAIARLNAGNR